MLSIKYFTAQTQLSDCAKSGSNMDIITGNNLKILIYKRYLAQIET